MTPLFTSSWDDGHPLDLRLAQLLARYNLKGTFYIPSPESGLTILDKHGIRALRATGMEIGAHTMTHTVLTGLDDNRIRREGLDGRHWLEDMLGEPVTAFSYPLGKFNRRVCAVIRECGFRLARTTVAFHTSRVFDPFRMPVSQQWMPHPRQIHVRHALHEGNAKGLIRWLSAWRAECDIEALAALIARNAVDSRGVFHVWGHSWEIEQHGLWTALERVLCSIAKPWRFKAVSNSELLR